jgi:amidase
VVNLDFGKINPVSGPIFVEGAMPGDAIKVTIDSFAPQLHGGKGFGWTANIPGFGLLADQFTDPALHIWSYDAGQMAPALWGREGRVPLKPFAGTIGNALAEAGLHSVVPPRRVGGNLDIRDLTSGVTLYLPVEVPGALFSVGDTHAAQGDGEVCGTAIESPMDVVLTLDLVKGANLKTPRFTTPGPVTRHLDAKGYEVTTGIGPDLMAASRDAVANMIDLLCAQRGMAAVEAYMLVSTCGDLRISEIVDMPNWVVSFYFPRCVFE